MSHIFGWLFAIIAWLFIAVAISIPLLLIGDIITESVFGFCLLDALFPIY